MTHLGFLVTIVLAASTSCAFAQERVEVRSINASVKLEEMIYGHLDPSPAQRQI